MCESSCARVSMKDRDRKTATVACDFFLHPPYCRGMFKCVCLYMCVSESEEGVCDVKPRQAQLWSKFRLLSGGSG